MQKALGLVPNAAKRKQCYWQCLGEPVNTATWRPCLHDGITNSYSCRGAVIDTHFVLFSLLRAVEMDVRVQAISWQGHPSKWQEEICHCCPSLPFKPARKASRMSAMNKRSLGRPRARVLAVLSDCDLQPQARK